MTPESQRIAIAEACGYSIGEKAQNGIVEVLKNGKFQTCFTGKRIANPTLSDALEKKCLPNYLNDLNAMREAEKVLTATEQQDEYCRRLAFVCWGDFRQNFILIHATATQRAQAFLMTLGLWTK